MAFNQHAPANFDELADQATRAFVARFHREPLLVAGAPGRVNLLGEHVDYVGGWVLPIATSAPNEPGDSSSTCARRSQTVMTMIPASLAAAMVSR